MATFVLVHGAGMSGWSWGLVAARLTAAGHCCAAPDLPDTQQAGLGDYVHTIVDAAPDPAQRPMVVVGHSWGAFPAALAAPELSADLLVLVGAMIPTPGERPADWWADVGFSEAVREQAARDGGLTGNGDEAVRYYHDVPDALEAEAGRHGRSFPSPTADGETWHGERLDAGRTRVLVTENDRLFTAELQRRLGAERVGIDRPERIDTGHMPMLARPDELAQRLEAYAAEVAPRG